MVASADGNCVIREVVVDLAKDPLAAGPLARSSTRNPNLDKALAAGVSSISRNALASGFLCSQTTTGG